MTNYKALKAVNPTLPLLIRECAGAEARLTARYGAHPHARGLSRGPCALTHTLARQSWEGRRWCLWRG